MGKKRNGILEIYRFIICFWPIYCHNFFFVKDVGEAFTVAHLAVDFFYIISGLFLIKSMRKYEGRNPFYGAYALMRDRLKPIFFPMCFIVVFNLICFVLFIRENYLDIAFDVFCFWWYVLYLVIAIALYYLLYRAIKNEKLFAVAIAVIMLASVALHYVVIELELLPNVLMFVARTFACLACGMLLSYVPPIKMKKPVISIIALIVLIPAIFYFTYYRDKNYLICLALVVGFAALVYFTRDINVGGKMFDLLGKLSTRMYLYMAFIAMLRELGVENQSLLFVIDVSISVLDVTLDEYRSRCKKLTMELDKKNALLCELK